MNSIWYNKLELQIEEKLETLHAKDAKFYRVDYFLKLAKEVDRLSSKCVECKILKNNIEYTADDLDRLLSGQISYRKEYERKLEEIDKHLRKTHNIYPKQYFLYLYTFLGMLGGLILGFLISMIFSQSYLKVSLLIGFTIGLFAGRIWGKVQEKKHNTI